MDFSIMLEAETICFCPDHTAEQMADPNYSTVNIEKNKNKPGGAVANF